ncbi:hypothetical protein BaRGS_00002947 [Batillaria attramentaria]|uniref:Uncharacterized protein n=1 Tax=Batillaria attramentaria TaxID=370345 RepID=A0ABD0M1S9_9CAEN
MSRSESIHLPNLLCRKGPSFVFPGRNPWGEGRAWEELIKKEKVTRDRHVATFDALKGVTGKELAEAQSFYGRRLYQVPPQMRVFDRVRNAISDPYYDRWYRKDSNGYAKVFANNARREDEFRPIPVLSNNEYGHRIRKPLETFENKYGVKGIARSLDMYDVRAHRFLPFIWIKD